MLEVQAGRAFYACLSAFLRGLDEWMVERIFNGDAISIREMASVLCICEVRKVCL